MAAGEVAEDRPRLVAGRHTRWARLGETAFAGVLALSMVLALAVLFVLVAQVVAGSLPVWRERAGGFLTSGLSVVPDTFGVWQGIKGSLYIGAITALLSFPIGIATAVYLEEYAPDSRLTRFIDVNIRNLAGVPSVVYGLLGLAVFVELLGGREGSVANLTGGSSVLSAGLTLAVLVLPIVIITSAEALRSVPDSLRRGGSGLGATRWQVTRRLVLPEAAPGMLTGTILGLSRAIGETAPLLVVGVVTGYLTSSNIGLLEALTVDRGYTALPVIVFQLARQPGDVFQEVLGPATIVVLLVFTLSLNSVAIWLRNRFDVER